VVFDFDGTLTDPWRIAEPFERALREEISRASGLSLSSLDAAWSAVLRDEPSLVGLRDFAFGGLPMAPARADPWLRASVRGREAVRRATEDAVPEQERERWMVEAFGRAYPRVPAGFRTEARALVRALVDAGTACFVVSNSDTGRVRERLVAEMGSALAGAVTVLGGAQKFSSTPARHPTARRWESAIPRVERFDEAEREVVLHRGCYLDALATVCERAEVAPSELHLCGDVFELDLAVALAIGARVHFVQHAGSVEWERRAVLAREGCTAGPALPALA
jgi:FMN phosphatase YigB (HAD superfamily)